MVTQVHCEAHIVINSSQDINVNDETMTLGM